MVYKSMDEKEINIRLFLDLSKAFCLVDHDILLRKMGRMEIRGEALNWFQPYLESRGQELAITFNCKETNKITDCLSQRTPISHGILQGCSGTCVVFTIYI
jgi:hypothetical protein